MTTSVPPNEAAVVKPNQNDVAAMFIVNEQATIHLDSRVGVLAAKQIVEYILTNMNRRCHEDITVGDDRPIYLEKIEVGDDHLILKLRPSADTGRFTQPQITHLHELVPARVIRTARIEVTVDRDPNRVHIGTTIQLTYVDSDWFKITAADIKENVPGVGGDPTVRNDEHQIVVDMMPPSFKQDEVVAFVDTLLAYLKTGLLNPIYKVKDRDPNAQRRPEYRWRPPASAAAETA
ncbi:MAG TPA: hypothetical protein VLA88_02815 [Candidatus Saccharimonadales bacterium]|nr:hypothetical protein [Candidatus Saccharimonadales bacterium]